MYTIGICDDNELFCWKLENFILDYCNKIHWEIETIILSSGEELLKHWNKGQQLDMLFLDIELNTMSGITIGNKIRKNLENESTQIVFVSIKKDYALQLFKIRPLDFIVKPISYDEVARVIDTYCRLFVSMKPLFEYHYNKKIYRIDQRNIIYLQSAGKIITIHTTQGNHQYYGKLSESLNQLNSNCFFCVHQSFIININYVMEYQANELLMSDFTRIPISQSRRIEFRQTILRHQIESRTI